MAIRRSPAAAARRTTQRLQRLQPLQPLERHPLPPLKVSSTSPDPSPHQSCTRTPATLTTNQPTATPEPHRPSTRPPHALNLRGTGLEGEDGVSEPQHAYSHVLCRRRRGVERHKEVACTLREALEGIDPIAHADWARGGTVLFRVRGLGLEFGMWGLGCTVNPEP